jgi:hypothetical protein
LGDLHGVGLRWFSRVERDRMDQNPRKEGFHRVGKLKILNINDRSTLIENKKDERITEISKTLIYLQCLDEDMANYLEELILKEMEFDMRGYSKQVQGTWFYPYFKKWGRKRFVEYIENWNNANFKAPQFMKTFLKFLNKIEVERYPKVYSD